MTSVRNGPAPRHEEAEAAVREALAAVERAHLLLRAPGDPLMAAVDSAVTCAVSLMVLRQSGPTTDLDELRDVLGSARALVGEVTFALRDRARTGGNRSESGTDPRRRVLPANGYPAVPGDHAPPG